MKTRSRFIRSLLGARSFAAAVILALLNASGAPEYAAHEWGTFTSVQGGDGVLLSWRPLESSALPNFVYDWNHAGLGRRTAALNPFSKASITTLQRMETPVIYFYADQPQTVDVAVKFPKGIITEWYPQAAQIGPAFVTGPDTGCAALRESKAHWTQVELQPTPRRGAPTPTLPFDRSGSHYFAARETDAAYVSVKSLESTRTTAEREKFIFYRGAGSFGTPLRVTVSDAGNSITVSNTGSEALAHLFVLGLQNQAGKFTHLDRLAPGEQRIIQVDLERNLTLVEKLSAQLGKAMAKALVGQGLYDREATAMVNTWKDSWFAEDGLRVLYVLPRAWTDQTLPLTLTPAPKNLVRVMVGRAEVLAPPLQQKLTVAIKKANAGDARARADVVAEFKTLGRFAEPAAVLATKGLDQKVSQVGWQLYSESQKPPLTKTAAFSPYE